MSGQDELTIPYLIFRIWRNYYDALLFADGLGVEEKSERCRCFSDAVDTLARMEQILLARGASPGLSAAVSAAVADGKAVLASSDDTSLQKYICEQLHSAAELKAQAAKRL